MQIGFPDADVGGSARRRTEQYPPWAFDRHPVDPKNALNALVGAQSPLRHRPGDLTLKGGRLWRDGITPGRTLTWLSCTLRKMDDRYRQMTFPRRGNDPGCFLFLIPKDFAMPISTPSIRQSPLLAASLLMIWGCGVRVGPVATNGTYLNLNGEAVNAYANPLPETMEAALQVLAFLKVPVGSHSLADGAGIITATAPDGSPLHLQFVEEGRALTVVKIRTGAVGYWGRELSYYLQALINERLKHPGIGAPDAVLAGKAPPKRDAAGPIASLAPPEVTPKPHSPAPPSPGPSMRPDASIYFEANSNLPQAGELAKLDALARLLFENPSWRLSLVGYAENEENEGQPQMVAENRVLAVKFYLIGKGLDGQRLVTHSDDPGGEEADRRGPESRRVDLLIERPNAK